MPTKDKTTSPCFGLQSKNDPTKSCSEKLHCEEATERVFEMQNVPCNQDREMPWINRMIATAKLDHVELALGKPARATYPREVTGSRDEFVFGFWLSDTRRARGVYRLGDRGRFQDVSKVTYAPAGMRWDCRLDAQCEVGPSLHCKFDSTFFKSITGLDADANPADLNGSIVAPSPLLTQALWLLVDELKNPGFAHAITTEALSKMILVEIGRSFRQVPKPAFTSSGQLATWQIERVRMLLESTLETAVRVSDVAHACGISDSHFRRAFKLSTGVPFSLYVERLKTDRAKALLNETSIPLKVISHRLGFRHPSAFSNAFRKATGFTPRAYRQMSKG